MSNATALLVGLTHVDSAAYNGWDGRNGCAGCATDVANLSRILTARGWEVRSLLDKAATRESVLGALHELRKEARAGDSVFFYFSGHGGQMLDNNNDESDQMDETLVCFDGELRDDQLDEVWTNFVPGVELFMLSDSCNSGTNYKFLNRDFPVRVPILPLSDLKRAGEMRARMLHMGGCRDAYTSTGLQDGGVFTSSVVKFIDQGFNGNWRELYELVRPDVSETQDPQLNLYPVNGNTLDLRRPFIPGHTAPGSGSAVVRHDTVEFSGNLAEGEEMLRRIDRVIAAREAGTRSGVRGGGVRLVAEGDSWFDFKIAPDVIDWLESDYGYDIKNQSKAGACVYEMAYGPDNDSMLDVFGRDASELEEVVKHIRRHRPQAILLSGAGNDFAGPEFVMTIHHAAARKSGLNRGVIEALFAEEIEPAYRLMIETMTAAARDAGLGTPPIITHGYDYAFPDGRAAANFVVKKIGPWMHPSFALKGYPYRNEADLEVRRQIVAGLIDALYIMLGRLARSYPWLKIVDVRRTLPTRAHWHDELHPSREGFRSVARLFHQAISQAIGGGPGGNRGPSGFPVTPSGGEPSGNLPEPPAEGAFAPAEGTSGSSNRAAAEILKAPPKVLESLLHSRTSQSEIRQLIETEDAPALVERLNAARNERYSDLRPTAPLPPSIEQVDERAWIELEQEVENAIRFGLAEPSPSTRTAELRTAPTYEARKALYERLFKECVIREDKRDTVAWYRKQILNGQSRYEDLGEELGIGWAFIGIIHGLECSFGFDKHLHNGDPLNARTVRVPRNRPPEGNPPFSWKTSARDALTMPGKLYHLQTDWSIPAMLYRFEKYNGFGYISKGIQSPYLWSFSNHYTKGKFVSDGVYSSEAVSKQAGAAVILKDLIERGIFKPAS